MRIERRNSLFGMRRALVCCGLCLATATAPRAQSVGDVPSSATPASGTATVAEATDTQAIAQAADGTTPAYVTKSLRGRIVWLAEALERRFGIVSDTDAKQAVTALESTDGQLYPLVKDDRGRGFWLDPRLHGVDMELRVRRFHGSPMVQVIRVYTIEEDEKYELDYWCDICAIPMYELKPCECCQGPIRFRRRLVEEDPATPQSTQQGDDDVGDASR